jgi:beta-lactamase class A
LANVKHCIRSGWDVNTIDGFKWTALCWAARYGHYKMAKYLLKHGADVDCLVTKGQTPLMLASMRGHLELVHLLIEWGASDKVRDHDGYSALDWAMQWDASQPGWTVQHKSGVWGGQVESMHAQPRHAAVVEALRRIALAKAAS